MMTEKAVVNARGGESEVSENGHDDQHKVKDDCIEVARVKENEEEEVSVVIDGGKIDSDNASVGGSDAVAADGGSGELDLVAAAIDNNGAGASAGDGDGESQVTVMEVAEDEAERKCEVVVNVSAEEEVREMEISNGTVSVESTEQGADGEKDLGSVTVTVSDVSGDEDVNKIESVVGAEDVLNGVADRELSEIHGDANGSVIVTDVTKINNDRDDDAVDVQNGVENEICGDANGSVTVTDVTKSSDQDDVVVDVQNGVGNEIHGDSNGSVTVTDVTKSRGQDDDAVDVQNGVRNEIRGDSNGSVTDTDVTKSSDQDDDAVDVPNGVEKEVCDDDVNGVQECEIVVGAGEVLGDADGNRNHGEFESVAVQNGLAVESEVAFVVDDGLSATDEEECAAAKGKRTDSDEKVQIESLDSGGGDEKDGGTVVQERSESVSDTGVDRSLQCEHIGVTDVSDEKDIVTAESQDGESKFVVGSEDVQDGLADTKSECAEKNVISVDVDSASATTDVKECADEEDQNGVEKAQVESATDTDVEKSVVAADIQNGLAELELGECTDEKEVPVEGESASKLESSEEIGHELVSEGENLSAQNSTDMTRGGNVVPHMNENAVESEGEHSVDMSGMKNIAVENESEPSNNALESEPEPSNNALVSEAEPSNNALESAPEPCANMLDMKNNPMESETEPSVEGKLSVEGEGDNHGEGDSKPTQEGSAADTFDGQNVGSEVVKRPFYYLIRLPRYDDDENLREQIENAHRQVEEKTKIRDAIRAENQAKKAIFHECRQDVRDAVSAERAARDLLKSKRQEMDSVQSTVNRLNNVISVGDIDGKIRNMEHMIQHETLPLNEEKQLIRQIKQLKQSREELSSSMAKQDQSQQSIDQKDSIEEHFKRLQLLRREMDLLRNNLLKAEAATKAARKKYDDESNKLSKLRDQFNSADDIRQEAYAKLQSLKNQLHEKSKYFWEYRNVAKKANELATEGKKEQLQCFCVDQVERIMELWNKNDEFRRNYIRCNTRSTLRRLQTHDGRSLGPDEEPPVVPYVLTERTFKNNSLILKSIPEQEKKSTSIESVNITKDEPVSNVVVQRTENSQTSKAKKPTKPATSEKSLVAAPRWGDEPEDTIEEPVRAKEEEELILKAEKARKEEEEAKLKEKRRLEEIGKAKEAMERKKRNAEKAQQRAALRAQKEAEQKEKEREKKARKKERRKAASTEPAENTEQESAPILETLTRSIEETDQTEKSAELTKRLQKPSQFTRQTKPKSVPLPLRNRGKRRIQPWMWWVMIAVLVVVALLYVGNDSSLRSWLQGAGF